jgi:hypothetical protein
VKEKGGIVEAERETAVVIGETKAEEEKGNGKIFKKEMDN